MWSRKGKTREQDKVFRLCGKLVLALIFVLIARVGDLVFANGVAPIESLNDSNNIDTFQIFRLKREEDMGIWGSKDAKEEPVKQPRCRESKYDQLIAQQVAQGNLSQPVVQGDGTFDNPFSTWAWPSLIEGFKSFMKLKDNAPKDDAERDKELPLLKPDFEVPPENERDFRVTWIGHASVLIQTNGFNILADPMFSDRASPFSFAGPKRIREPACKISDLPHIDAVVISHNHYDHLDTDSVRELNARLGPDCRWVVPLGVGEYMRSMGVENYRELTWWERDCIKTKGAESPDKPELSIFLTPTQHWSRRGLNDRNKSLWGSYVIVNQDDSRWFFTGDTGYCSAFKEIGRIFGPFAGAAIPIGAYKPRNFMKYGHVDPDEAVEIHKDIGSADSISIHHSTFILSEEHYKDPTIRLNELMDQMKQNDSANYKPFRSVKHGETVVMKNLN